MIRSENPEESCPTNSFIIGEPQGQCWGDGHFQCKNCIHYRKDFETGGQEFIDFVHQKQGEIQLFEFINKNNGIISL